MPEPGQYKCGFCQEGTGPADGRPPCDKCALAILLEKYPEFIHTMKEHSRELERFIMLAPRSR